MAHPPFTSSHQTRLLYLHPASWSDDLIGNIDIISLDDCPRYTALSYAWEDGLSSSHDDLPRLRQSIICNGHAIVVSATLGRALRHLRDEQDLRILWIDKICINQADILERQQQVSLMGRIYGGADSVAVWLGESDEHTKDMWELLHQARLYLRYHPAQTFDLAFRSPMTFPMSGAVQRRTRQSVRVTAVPPELARIPGAHDPRWGHMRAFLSRPWLSRVWTLQEVAVAKYCYVMCGTFVMIWGDFHIGAWGLVSGGYSDYLLGHGIQAILLRDGEQKIYSSGHTSSLRSLLGIARGLDSMEGHDKVFALLSLISEVTAARIQLMYTRPLTDLYGDAARACIKEDKHLAVLGEIEIRTTGSEMPSWAPDWREKSPTRIMLNAISAGQGLYRSAGDTEPVILPSDSPETLVLRGRLIAPIEKRLHLRSRLNLTDELISHSARDLDALRWSPQAWCSIYRGAVTRHRMPVTVARNLERGDALSFPGGPHDSRQTLDPAGMLAHALRRTVTADLYPRPDGRLSKTMADHHFPAHAAWQARDFEGSPPADVLHEHDLAARNTMINRLGFIAGGPDDAYLGIGLCTLRQGDWVCVLDGGHTPFILRPHYNESEQTAEECWNWSLISECYVHGLMDGEAMDSAKDFPQKDFSLGKSQAGEAGLAKL